MSKLHEQYDQTLRENERLRSEIVCAQNNHEAALDLLEAQRQITARLLEALKRVDALAEKGQDGSAVNAMTHLTEIRRGIAKELP